MLCVWKNKFLLQIPTSQSGVVYPSRYTLARTKLHMKNRPAQAFSHDPAFFHGWGCTVDTLGPFKEVCHLHITMLPGELKVNKTLHIAMSIGVDICKFRSSFAGGARGAIPGVQVLGAWTYGLGCTDIKTWTYGS